MGDDFFNNSGAAANYTRHTKPPVSLQKKVKDDPFKDLPSIDLQNFEAPGFEDSRYILTSPRSLEACARVGVKPIDLLYKGLRDYELDNPEMPIREVYTKYENGEEQRKTNLRKAREERQRIILENGCQTKSNKPSLTNPKVCGENIPRKKATASHNRSSNSYNNAGNGDSAETKTNIQQSNSITNSPRRSTIRRNPSSDSGKLRTYKLAAHNSTQTASRERNRSMTRAVPMRNETFDSLSRSNKTKVFLGRTRSLSADNSMSSINRCRLSAQEKNRLNIMAEKEKSKLEEQKRQREMFIERQLSIAARNEEHKLLADENRKQHQLEQTRKELLRLERKYQQEVEMLAEVDKRKKSIDFMDEKRRRNLDNERSKMEDEISFRHSVLEEKQTRAQLYQEIRESEDNTIKNLKLQQSEEALRRAEQQRLRNEAYMKEKKKIENQTKLEQFRERRAILEKKSEEDVGELQELLSMRDNVVQHNQKKIQMKREKSFAAIRDERERRMQATAERRKQLEAEIEEYKTELQHYQESSMRRADERFKQKLDHEKQSVKDRRSEKQRQYYEKLEKIKRAEEVWKEEAEEILKMKDERLKQIEEEKQNKIKESRQMAQAAAKLREDIKREYQNDSFDKLVRQAELVNHLGLGHNTRRS